MTDTFQIDPNALAELFPADATQATTPEVVPDAQLTPAAVQPVVPSVQDEVFVKAASGTVYKTREAAEQGIAQKDALIEQMRQRIQLATGIDPISQRPVQVLADNRGDSYQTNKQKYVDDLKKASTPEELVDVQTKFMLDALAPIAPAITAATRAQAINRTEQDIPGFRAFYGSAQYKETLEKVPDLRDAIDAAEADLKFHDRLPGLYKVAQLVSQGIQLPELLKAKPTQQSTTPQRPTNTGSTSAPPETTTSAPGLNSSAGRKAIIESFEKANTGVLNW